MPDAGMPCADTVEARLLDGTSLTDATGLTVCLSSSGRAVGVNREGARVCPPGETKSYCPVDAGACADECTADEDCGAGASCLCAAWAPPAGQIPYPQLVTTERARSCVPAECTTRADCGGRACGFSVDICGANVGFHCRTGADQCRTADDCDDGRRCVYYADRGHWACDRLITCDNGWGQ